MRFNGNVLVYDMKERISAKIVRHCERRILRLFYKFSVPTDPIKFTKMELVDDEDVETMVALYYRNQSCQTDSIKLFAELADVESAEDFTPLDYSDPNLDEVSDDIDDEGANDDGNVNASSIENLSRCIMIRNDLGAHMSIINPNAVHASEFPDYIMPMVKDMPTILVSIFPHYKSPVKVDGTWLYEKYT
ncbi:hypothetical protein J1N35_041645 [Gossypium stocksii]|uniref:Uncharacterized protein n=1 Tax=Gossypium stocksii TaxID=47602 RepID=A0A9D3UFW2_9ROSI|nr:hypothetical protein J1N35_041645 [Gossypium stocksii]